MLDLGDRQVLDPTKLASGQTTKLALRQTTKLAVMQ